MNDDSVNDDRIAYSIKEACQLLNLSRATIDRAIKAGELTSAKIGNQHRISRLELARFFQDKGGGPLFFEGEKANQNKESFYEYFIGDGSHPEMHKGSRGAQTPYILNEEGEYVSCIEESLYRIANYMEEFIMSEYAHDKLMNSIERRETRAYWENERKKEEWERWQAKRKKANEQS